MTARGRVSAAQKARQAIDMVLRGCSYQEIADQVGYSNPQNACHAVTNALARYPARSIDQLREVEGMKLDRLEKICNDIIATTYYATCARGLVTDDDGEPVIDPAPALQAARTIIQIAARRARLLGLDQPVRISVENDQPDPDIELLLDSLLGRLGPEQERELDERIQARGPHG